MIKKSFYLIVFTGFLCGYFSSAWGADRGEIHSGETKIGLEIAGPSYMDTWTFYGEAGDRVIITAVISSGTLNTVIYLYPPDGGPCEANTHPWGDRLDHQLEQSGLYTIVIQDYSLNDEGTYNITLLKIPGAVSSSGDPDGGAIASGETSSGTIVASDIDAFQFYGEAGDRVIITAVTSSGTLNTVIYLYPPDGGPCEANTHPWGDRLDHQLEQSGLYTIVIQDYSLNDEGTYNISLAKIPSDLRPGIYNPYPPNSSTITNLNGSFSWDAVSGITGYDLYFGEDVVEPLERIGDNLPSPSTAFPQMARGRVYYWHVVAHTPNRDIQGLYWWFYVHNISTSPTSHDFGSVDIGSTSIQTFTVTNAGDADLVIGTLPITGSDAPEFSIQNNNCSQQTITPSESCTVDVVFAPTLGGQKSANLSIQSNAPDSPTLDVQLSGNGAETAQPDGDIAPWQQRDGYLNIGDAVVALRCSIGALIPTADDIAHGDVAPLQEVSAGVYQPNPDGMISIGDAVVILRAVVGLVTWEGMAPLGS